MVNQYLKAYEEEQKKKYGGGAMQVSTGTKNPYTFLTGDNKYTFADKSGNAYTFGGEEAPAPAVTPSAPVTPTSKNPYIGLEAEMNSRAGKGFDAYKKSRNAYADAGAKRLEAQKRGVNQNYEYAIREAGRAQDSAVKALPEQLAGLGLYGQGVGETAIAGIKSEYARQMGELLKQRDDNLYDIDSQIGALRSQAEADILNYHANLLAQGPDIYLKELQLREGWDDKERAYNDSREDTQWNRDKYDQEWAYKVESEADQTAYDRGRDMISDYYKEIEIQGDSEDRALSQQKYYYGALMDMVESGETPPPELITAAGFEGYDDFYSAIAGKNNKLYEANLAKAYKSGSGGSGGGSGMNKQQNMLAMDSDLSKAIYSIYDIGSNGYYNPKITTDNTESQLLIAYDKIMNEGAAIKSALAAAGWTASQAENKYEEYKQTVINKIVDKYDFPEFDHNGDKVTVTKKEIDKKMNEVRKRLEGNYSSDNDRRK